MLKRVNKEQVCCPVVFFEENFGFQVKKSQIDNEIDKNPKFSNLQSFYAVFVKFMTDFSEWNVKKGQQGKRLLSSSLL